MSDPWADAATAPAGDQNGGSQLSDSYAGKPSALFSPGGDGVGPSLLNKTHPVGTERTGIIARPTFDRHSTTMKGELKYWPQDNSKKPVLDAVDRATGQPNRKVYDTIVVLDTEYTMDATEAAALNREQPFEGGRRSYTINSAEEMKKFKEAIVDAVKRGVPLTSDEDMVGKRLTVKRTGQKPNPHGGDPIKVHEFRIDAA